jgi:predicted TIM-barrel fold metal-dependent hydrolase
MWERDAELFPPGTKGLADVGARLRAMDVLGLDVQVLYPTFWLIVDVPDPVAEAALMRSYNRWLAEATAPAHGRLLWAIATPTKCIDRAREELRFGREHGAVALFLHGTEDGLPLSNPYFFPLYEQAQELGLVVAVHVGTDSTHVSDRIAGPERAFDGIVGVPHGFHSILVSDLHSRFPEVKWAFLEAGAAWVPWVLQEAARADEYVSRDESRDWRTETSVLRDRNFFVACQIDDDLEYLTGYTGRDNVVLGSDWGHYDVGSDPAAHQILAARDDLDPALRTSIVDTNGRRLYGLPDALPAA